MSTNMINRLLRLHGIADRIRSYHNTGGTHYFYFGVKPSNYVVDFLIERFTHARFLVD